MKKDKTKQLKPLISSYSDSWNYIKSVKNYTLFSLYVFLISILIAVLFPTPLEIKQYIRQMLMELASRIDGLNTFQLISYIFVNNLFVSLISILAGIFFCIFPFFTAISNGYILGYVSKLTVQNSSSFNLLALFPHGIFEFPAIILSLGLGMRLGVSFAESLIKRSFIIKKDFVNIVKIIFLIIVPLLVIAAIIEGFLAGILS